MKKNRYGHFWDICERCGPMVECGVCGNNSCNGGNGWQIHQGGSAKCPGCDSAYEMMMDVSTMPKTDEWKKRVEEWKINSEEDRKRRKEAWEKYRNTDEGKEAARKLNEQYHKEIL